MNRVKVYIAGKDYILQTEEEERYVLGLAKKLDKTIKDMLAGDGMSLTSACVLAALDAFDEKEKQSVDADNLRYQLKQYIDESGKMNQRIYELEREIEKLTNEKADLQSELKLYSLKEKLDT